MAQQPDKLFRDKLLGYQREVPHTAWNRVAENLQQEKEAFPWLRIAAAVLLLAVALIFLVTLDENVKPVNIAEKSQSSEKPGEAPATPLKQPEEDPGNAGAGTKASQEMADRNLRSRRAPMRREKPTEASAVREAEKKQPLEVPYHAETVSQAPDVAANDSTSQQFDKADAEAVASASQPAHHMTIVFSAEEVNDKYLDKKEMADATPESKAASSLRKLLDKAYALKHNQDPMGELRQKKNEILAFNFKDDKPRHD